MTRLDATLVSLGQARSRSQAHDLVTRGLVRVNGIRVTKPAYAVAPGAAVEVQAPGPVWVSRAAEKLVGALESFPAVLVEGRRCLDVGASTGGFTQVLLHRGARHVIALDVGHGQLAPEVAHDERVDERSGTTVRGLSSAEIGGPVDLLVADLSFISLTAVLPELAGLVTPQADLILLVKPQFEVGRTRLGKNGIVRKPGDRALAITSVARAAQDLGLSVCGLERSALPGSTGNQEYVVWLTPRSEGAWTWDSVVLAADRLSLDGAL